jgi:lysozyme
MKISSQGREYIKTFEQLKLYAYWDEKAYSIGYGVQTYENGTAVKSGDRITKERAESLFLYTVNKFAEQVNGLITSNVNQNQFDMLVSLAYNIGIGNFRTSTLLKKVNINPNDASIRNEFNKWKFANGRVLSGLVSRRAKEAEIYFSPVANINTDNLKYLFLGIGIIFLIFIIFNNESRYKEKTINARRRGTSRGGGNSFIESE